MIIQAEIHYTTQRSKMISRGVYEIYSPPKSYVSQNDNFYSFKSLGTEFIEKLNDSCCDSVKDNDSFWEYMKLGPNTEKIPYSSTQGSLMDPYQSLWNLGNFPSIVQAVKGVG